MSIVEVILASALIAAALISVIAVAGRSLEISRRSLHLYQASLVLEEGAESVRTIRDNAWTNISGLTSGTTYYLSYASGAWSLSTTPSTVDIFTRTVTLSDVYRNATTQDIVSTGGVLDSGTKLVTVSVTWNEGTTTMTKTLPFYIAKIF